MSKVILEFDAVEDQEEIQTALNGWRWKATVVEIDNFFRSELKYNPNLSEELGDRYEAIREKIRDIMYENKVQFD